MDNAPVLAAGRLLSLAGWASLLAGFYVLVFTDAWLRHIMAWIDTTGGTL